MSTVFREFVKKIGSGEHTHTDLSREEAYTAMKMMLQKEATPAQIGAFLIAHRIKRPTSAELAGMLDAYYELGPQLPALDKTVVILSQPYDGRDRTIPLSPLTALVLSSVGIPVLQHGGDCMPTKEGVPLIDIWQGLGINWRNRSLTEIHALLREFGLGFIYVPEHFPLAYDLVPYRAQIGKRPPIATLELIWCPYAGAVQLVAGYVHPPTEIIITEALHLLGKDQFITVKGLEGSCDLPRDRACITAVNCGQRRERLIVNALHYSMKGSNPRWSDLDTSVQLMTAVLEGQTNELQTSVIWNSGFYLWQCGYSPDLVAGLTTAKELLVSNQVKKQWQQLRSVLD
ncbi:MAG: anthranilate phosphoribosyltransferase family protein [Pseudanabaenaceae cyanobacterium SKYGB_i_bin29]|nr:anthranilate phosphoribosyltransferase family protein [Pseudanabaenaceae cyanobacterium SKYG29]MDW8421858.1 anthranilate phosphoribosyltransferase family protein [Pseudanabaenaceae cyanobacterium SKYGB_i_bin29]